MDFSLSFSAEFIEKHTNELLQTCQQQTAALLAEESPTFQNMFGAFHQTEAIMSAWSCKLVLGSMVHVDAPIREACNVWKGKVKDWFDSRYGSKELYEKLKSAAGTVATDGLDKLDHRLVHSTIALFQRNGVGLSDGDRAVLLSLRKQIGQLEIEFQKNLGEDVSFAEYSKEQLAGCDDVFLESLERSGKLYVVTVKPPHMRAIMETCNVEATRRAHAKLSSSRCKVANSAILAKLVRVRADAAHILGFKSWVEYKLVPTMAKKPENVWQILVDLFHGVEKKLTRELEELKQEKSSQMGGAAVELNLWDLAFYEKLVLKSKYAVDDDKVRSYLPMSWCIEKVIYQYLFGLRFEENFDPKIKWHEEVRVFAVKDDSSMKVLGYFYIDLFARPGKYAHQCVIPLAPCFVDADGGGYRVPVVANISNLSAKSTSEKPALLAHGELITFFHEFGHAVHALCTHSKYSTFSWSWNAVPYAAGVEVDFLEVPSKGFENWSWESEVLKIATLDAGSSSTSKIAEALKANIAGKAEMPPASPAPMPDDLIANIKKTRYAFAGYDIMRMIFMTAIDLIFHAIPGEGELKLPEIAREILPAYFYDTKITKANLNADDMLNWWKLLQQHFCKMLAIPDTNPLANWYHLAMGYDAGYYGYIWSEGVAMDIYKTLFSKACLSREKGLLLREKILSQGSCQDADAMTRDLLGRAPKVDALLDSILTRSLQ